MQDPRDAALPPYRFPGSRRRAAWRKRLTTGIQSFVKRLPSSPLVLPGSISLLFWMLLAPATAWLVPPSIQPLKTTLPVLSGIPQHVHTGESVPVALLLYAFIAFGLALSYIWGIRACGQGPSSLLPRSWATGRVTLQTIILFTALFAFPIIFAPGVLTFAPLNDIAAGQVMIIENVNPFNGSHILLNPAIPLYQFVTPDRLAAYGGPAWTLILALLGSFNLINDRDPIGSLLALRVVCAAIHLCTVWLVWRCNSVLFRSARTSATLLYAWNPLLLNAFVLNASREVITLGVLALGLWLYLQQNRITALLAFALAALTNPVVGFLLLPYLALLASQRTGFARFPLAKQIWLRSAGAYASLVAGVLLIGTLPVWAGNTQLFRVLTHSLVPFTLPAHASLSGWIGTLIVGFTGADYPLLWGNALSIPVLLIFSIFLFRTLMHIRRLVTMLWLWVVSWVVLSLLVAPDLSGASLAGVILLAALRGGNGMHRILIVVVTIVSFLYYPLSTLAFPWPPVAMVLMTLPPLLLIAIKHRAFEETGFETQVAAPSLKSNV